MSITINVTPTSGGTIAATGAADAVTLTVEGGIGPPGTDVALAAGTGIAITQVNNTATISSTVEAAANLADLGDVTLGSLSSGQVLAYNGTAWTARADHVHNLPTFAEITNGTATVTGNLTLNASTGSVTLNGGTAGSGSLTLNCEQNTHGVTIQGPPHSAAATYTLTLPTSDGAADQVLATDGNGSLSWADQSAGGGGITWSSEPAASNSTGTAGQIAYGSGFFYLHDGTEWRRAALSTFGGTTPTITITTQPQDLTLADGGSGNLSIVATVSDGSTPSYQWQNSDDSGATWDTLTGSTGTTYSLSGVSTLDNGKQFRAIVSAAGASDVTSNVATLTVTASATYDLLAENGDRLMTEGGGSLDHDGSGGQSGGDWEEVQQSLSLLGREFAYSPDADTAYKLVDTTSSGGFSVQGVQKFSRDGNGSWVSASNAKTTGFLLGEAVPAMAASSDGSRVIVVNDRGSPTDGFDFDFAGFTVYEDQNGTLASVYSGSQDNFTEVAISGDGSVFAAFDYYYQYLKVYSTSGIRGTPFSGGYQYQSITLNADGTKIAFSLYGDVTGDGNADSYSVAYQWTGSAWVAMGSSSDFVSSASVLSGQPRQPLAINDNGTRIAVGYSTATGDYTESGVVSAYDWNGSAWSQVGVNISGAAAYDLFGCSVALSGDGDRLIVGARGHDAAASSAGRVYTYEWSGSSWSLVGQPIDGASTTNYYFGERVFINNNGTAVGVYSPSADGGNGTLAAYTLNTTVN